MGASAETGVVDHLGQVFGYPNLIVADGAILPTPRSAIHHTRSRRSPSASPRTSRRPEDRSTHMAEKPEKAAVPPQGTARAVHAIR